LLISAFSHLNAPRLVTKELTGARSCALRSTHSIAILAMLDRLLVTKIDNFIENTRQTFML